MHCTSTTQLNCNTHWFLFIEKKVKIKKGLPKHSLNLCHSALDCIQHVYQTLHSGLITIKDLRELADKKEVIIDLCICSLPFLRKLDGASDLSGATIRQITVQRIREFKYFIQVRQELLQLCRHLESNSKGKFIKGEWVDLVYLDSVK